MEFPIDLTRTEKRTFIRFFGLYLGGSLVLMIFIALLYYQNEKKLYFDLTKTKMNNIISQVSSKIIYAHMSNTKLDKSTFFNSKEYKISFYDKNKKKMFGNLDNKIDFSKAIIQYKNHFVLTNNSTYGHLGVYYIAIEENLFSKTIKNLQQTIIMIFFLIYIIVSLIGFYLAKLFLKPIKDEREKLNNFIKDTTHELNTPISAILMSVEGESLSQKQTLRVKLAAQRISELYKDLTYIFLEERENKESVTRLSLDENILTQLKYFDVLAEKKGIKIYSNVEKFSYKIDENDFIRLFNNILTNAIKYNIPNGKIYVTLKENSLSIKDTGIGIEDKKIKDIFKRYYRATTEQGGFGIGLSIVQDICNSYNIKFDVKSRVKEGTTFTFTF